MAPATLLTGGTGLIGGRLVPALAERGAVRLATRRPETPGPAGATVVGWDGTTLPDAALDGVDTVVHLSGEPVFGGLPTRARRGRIWSSRVVSTERLVAQIAQRPPGERPRTLVCASAVGFYGDRGETPLPEGAGPGEGFLADLCVAWEAAANRARALGLRVVRVRFGIVLARSAGALGLMAPIFRTGLAGRLGSGHQWFPWIHIDDAAALVCRAVADPGWSGPVNAVAPAPVRNRELTVALAARLHRPALLPVPSVAVRAALGPLADELLGSKRVVPEHATKAGFVWQHPALERALADLLA